MATVTQKVIPQSMAIVAAGISVCTLFASGNPAQASILTFFGEDLNSNEYNRLTSTPNSDTARNNFFSNLIGVGTESFESFSNYTPAPLSISFPGAGTATLTGDGYIRSTSTGTAGGRYPISGINYYENTRSFDIEFSQPVAAFGFYGTDIGDINGQITLSLANGANSELTVPNSINIEGGSALYYGIITNDPSEVFTKVTFGNTAAGADVFGFDNMTIGSLTQVNPNPDPDPNPTPDPFDPDPNPTPVPFEFSPGLGILALGACGAMSQLKSKLQKRKFAAKL